MKISVYKSLGAVLVLITAIVMSASNLPAADLPLLDYVGDFNYLYSHQECIEYRANGNCKTYGTLYDYKLTLLNSNITGGNYKDGTYFGGSSGDPITDAWFEIGLLYNSSSNNLTLGSTSGGSGTVTFSITDGTNTFLSGELGDFGVTDNFFGTNLNAGSLTNISYWTENSSRYINELQSTSEPFRLVSNFTFNSGPSGSGNAFTANSNGTIGGKLEAGTATVVPEPASSILFLSGVGLLIIRRFYKKTVIAKL